MSVATPKDDPPGAFLHRMIKVVKKWKNGICPETLSVEMCNRIL